MLNWNFVEVQSLYSTSVVIIAFDSLQGLDLTVRRVVYVQNSTDTPSFLYSHIPTLNHELYVSFAVEIGEAAYFIACAFVLATPRYTGYISQVSRIKMLYLGLLLLSS